MNPIHNSHIDFEILISTQSQTSLDFLVPMFKNQDYKDFYSFRKFSDEKRFGTFVWIE